MWGSRLRSALFVDFENIGSRMSPAALRAMTAWLEDGRFDEAGRKRRLVSKRVYWNSSAEKHRDTFEAAGFEVVLCEKFSAMKNGADIRMALDVLDSCWKAPGIKEYILFTTDSDFVPVLQRLTEKRKLSAILVNEATMVSHTAFRIYADLLVPVRELTSEGLSYTRPEHGWLQALVKRRPAHAGAASGRTAATPVRPAQAGAAVDQTQGKAGPALSLLAQAERAVLRVASRTPQKFVPRKDIEEELQLIKGFKKAGPNAYLGKQHYQGLMLEVARMNKRIKVQQGRNNSASVMYVPED
jgi:hypothetical protein